MNTTQVRLDEMRGAPVYANDGDKIGSVEEIFYDTETQQPEWVGIGTGFLGTKRVLVPVEGASMRDDGLCVAYSKDQVKDAPDIDDDQISGETEQRLYEYYGLEAGQAAPSYDAPQSTNGESVTRSEEELRVGKQRVEAGSVRLRKWVETEPVALDVELQHETARVVREQIDQPAGAADDAFQEREVEVPLHTERAVSEKEVVAKERVGIQKDVETQTQTVEDDVRRERVEVDGEGDVEAR